MAGIGSCATSNMYEVEVVISEPVQKTISSWVWYNSTARCVQERLEDQVGIPQDTQRLVFPGRGILDDEVRMGHLFEDRPGHRGRPRLYLWEKSGDGQAEVVAVPESKSEAADVQLWHFVERAEVAGASSASSAVAVPVAAGALSASSALAHGELPDPVLPGAVQENKLALVPSQEMRAGVHWHDTLAVSTRNVRAFRRRGRPPAYVSRSGEVRHVFEYHSTGVPFKSVLTLIRATTGELLCEFLTRGHVADPHGVWSVSSHSSELRVLSSRFFLEVVILHASPPS